MVESIEAYLDRVESHLHLSSRRRERIRDEIREHAGDRARALASTGATPSEAVRLAIEGLGDPEALAIEFERAASLDDRLEHPRVWRAIIALPLLSATPLAAWAVWVLGRVAWSWVHGDTLVWGGCIQPDNTACLTDGIQRVESIAWAAVALVVAGLLVVLAGVVLALARRRAGLSAFGVRFRSPLVRLRD
jgi:hypothetical protein